jgi:hypothetical protein
LVSGVAIEAMCALQSVPVRTGFDQSQQPPGVAGDHQLLVGGDHPGRGPAVDLGDLRALHLVGLEVQLDAQPGAGLDDAAADLGGVLADAGGEDEPVDAAHHAGQPADLPGGAVDEIVHGQAGLGLAASQQVAHVIADAGDTQQARPLVEDGLHVLGREAQPLE